MASVSSPEFPVTSDPPLYDDWIQLDQNTTILPSISHSDELEALQLIHEESILKKNQEGQVIQYRAWKTGEAFRSDLDHPQGTK
jgi:chromosome transmission fidelity protein 18